MTSGECRGDCKPRCAGGRVGHPAAKRQVDVIAVLGLGFPRTVLHATTVSLPPPLARGPKVPCSWACVTMPGAFHVACARCRSQRTKGDDLQPVLDFPNGPELRPWRSSDADALVAAGQDPDVWHWNLRRRRQWRMHVGGPSACEPELSAGVEISARPPRGGRRRLRAEAARSQGLRGPPRLRGHGHQCRQGCGPRCEQARLSDPTPLPRNGSEKPKPRRRSR
jgi:hypothetical protein